MFNQLKIKIMTTNDVIVKIEEVSYPESKYVHYSVTSKLGAHTFINQADTIENAEKIAESHRVQLVQLYTPIAPTTKKNKKSKEETSDFKLDTIEEV